MAYTTVYSPDGKKHEVASRDRADKLILELGWTQTAPVDVEKVSKRAPKKKKNAERGAFDESETIKPKSWFSPADTTGKS